MCVFGAVVEAECSVGWVSRDSATNEMHVLTLYNFRSGMEGSRAHCNMPFGSVLRWHPRRPSYWYRFPMFRELGKSEMWPL